MIFAFNNLHFLLLQIRGSVSNMLVTSCRDNICRVWAETIPPEIEGLANMSQFEGSDRHGHHGKHRHHNMHKHRFMQRLKHMKYEEHNISYVVF